MIARQQQPSKADLLQFEQDGKKEFRRLAFFGRKRDLDESKRESAVKAYQAELEEQVFKNGGRLRDYQAEGIAWLVSNYINRRSSVLADGM
jgi:SNF2 family DNA or RNA helicase